MSETWMVVSDKEFELGNEIAKNIVENSTLIEECINAMRIVSKSLAKGKYNFDNSSIFASNSDSLSGNILAQIAYSISDMKQLNKDNGVVLTSDVLAEDMVKMGMLEWLAANTQCKEKDLVEYIFGNTAMPDDIQKMCLKIRWYDPCVGGGVFPMSIVSVYKNFKIEGLPCIYGYDINPLYVEATILRMTLIYGEKYRNIFQSRIKCRDALDTHLAQKSLLDDKGENDEYDITIGNPPYVRSGAISPDTRKRYMKNYSELEGKSTDLYTYFLCHGINVLAENGVLCYVTPAQFQMSNYGKPIRKVISKKTDLCAIADFNELPVFKKISVHTSVYCILKGKHAKTFRRYEYSELPDKNPLRLIYTGGEIFPQDNVSEKGWIFSSSKAVSVLDYLENKGIPLREYCEGVFSGIKSGSKDAFFMKECNITNFSKYDREHCVKMIIPKKITTWKSEWAGDYLALVKKDEILDEDSAIYAHMLNYRDVLENRSDIKGHTTWYGLRHCGYYDKFSAPKIIYPDISTECRFSMDLQGYFIPDGAFFIPGENYYLLGILNSCIGRYYFHQKCARIGNPQKGGRIRFKKICVENFPVIDENRNAALANEIAELAESASHLGNISEEQTKKLDKLVLQMYEVPDLLKNIVQEY